jgi:hypothetical protein
MTIQTSEVAVASADKTACASRWHSQASPRHSNTSIRADRYLDRIDRHLPTLPDDAARRSFLAQQLAGWEFRYQRWQLTDGASEPPGLDHGDPPQAGDFVLTIIGLAARRNALNPSMITEDQAKAP